LIPARGLRSIFLPAGAARNTRPKDHRPSRKVSATCAAALACRALGVGVEVIRRRWSISHLLAKALAALITSSLSTLCLSRRGAWACTYLGSMGRSCKAVARVDRARLGSRRVVSLPAPRSTRSNALATEPVRMQPSLSVSVVQFALCLYRLIRYIS